MSLFWKLEEDVAIKTAVRDRVSARRIAVRLNRSEDAVKNRAKQLGMAFHKSARAPHSERQP